MTAQKLKALMTEYAIDYRQLAEILDLAPRTILRWLSEVRPVGLTEGQLRLELLKAGRLPQDGTTIRTLPGRIEKGTPSSRDSSTT
jgi:hypothetical protein